MSLLVLTYVSPAMGATLAFVAASAVMLRRATDPEPLSPAVDSTAIDTPIDTTGSGAALEQVKRELGVQTNDISSPLTLNTPYGRVEFSSGHRNHCPFIGIRWQMQSHNDVTWVVRRKKSLLGLAQIVDNTPLRGSQIEYRLRQMPLPGSVAPHLSAGTSRPRLFREYVANSLGERLEAELYDPKYRLEELSFTGSSLTLLYVPASDPTTTYWGSDLLERSLAVLQPLKRFLDEAVIPSPHGP